LKPAAAILLNADLEHVDRYPNEQAVVDAYRKVLGQVSGPLVVVAKEEKAAMDAAGVLATKKTFGWEKSGADYTGTWGGEDKEGVSFTAKKGNEDLGTFRVAAPGRHNAANALGAEGDLLAGAHGHGHLVQVGHVREAGGDEELRPDGMPVCQSCTPGFLVAVQLLHQAHGANSSGGSVRRERSGPGGVACRRLAAVGVDGAPRGPQS
jgi:hypothetical protein